MSHNQNETNDTGKLKIGDDWNAITIIALSQTNPLKAIAEFVENSIDAGANNITIVKGRRQGAQFLKIVDDGEGIDDFKYVATHIGDSLKRKLKKSGIMGIQGEFGIGLLSFWTVGEELTLTSTGREKICRQMRLVKDNPGYSITEAGNLFDHTGTELHIKPLLSGIRQLSGEKIQNYLASELRDRINKSGVRIKIIDSAARREYTVVPRQFKGLLLHNLPMIINPLGDIYYELYLNEPSSVNMIGLYKSGTRVLPDITQIEQFQCFPWTSGYLEGMIDASFLRLTPGTRSGIIFDDAFESFINSMEKLNLALTERIEEQKTAEDEKASRTILQKITKALKEALSFLPDSDYEWLNVNSYRKAEIVIKEGEALIPGQEMEPVYVAQEAGIAGRYGQDDFFEIPGKIASASISPGSAVIGVGEKKRLKAIARDKDGKSADAGVEISWLLSDGPGKLSEPNGQFTEFEAPMEPGIAHIRAIIREEEIVLTAECVITVTQELISGEEKRKTPGEKKGLPGYTFQNAPGALWRSRYDAERYVIIINNSHADFIYASKNNYRKLRYITKLYSKELVLSNFPGAGREQLMERMIELQLYSEENLR